MTCEYRDALAAHLLGGVHSSEAVELDQHVLGCESCSRYRREMSIVRTLLDTLDTDGADPVPRPENPLATAEPPAVLADISVARMMARRQRHSLRDIRLFCAGVAAATVLGALSVSAYTWTHTTTPTTLQFVATPAAPKAWGEAKLHPRASGTIVDFEAGDLPRLAGPYVITITADGVIMARQEFSPDTDGWAQVVLATDQPIPSGYAIAVERLDGPRHISVLDCQCSG